MRATVNGLLLVIVLVLVGLSAAPAQARFFPGFGFPGFYPPVPVFYRPYLPPPPPPPPVVIAPRPVVLAPRPAVVVEPPPVVYRTVHYSYSRPIVRHHRHRVVARRFCRCR
jgi:hypothetical protein